MKRLLAAFLLASLLASCGLITDGTPGSGAGSTQPPVATTAAPATGAPATVPSGTATNAPTDTSAPTSESTSAATSEPTSVPSETPAPSAANIDPAAYQLAQVASGFARPLLVTHNGVDPDRLYVVEQAGVIRVLAGGALLPDPFLDIRGIVSSEAFERGLLGLAFHPRYAENGQFFVYYTDLNGDTAVARYQVGDDPDQADPDSAVIILQVVQPFPNHNGGHLAFGPDGHLYVGLGDGGSGGDPQGNGQNLGTLLGSILRLDVGDDQATSYTIPADNPFAGRSDVRQEIWVYGLRNPWRYSFDRATGDLYIGDVGQGGFEEVSFQPGDSPGGENYGWNYMEGFEPYQGQPPAGLELTPPIAAYPLARPQCAVTGGYVYRGPSLPALNGVYVYGDYCSGHLWYLLRENGEWQNELFMETGRGISSFGEDLAGELYVVDHGGGAVYRLTRR